MRKIEIARLLAQSGRQDVVIASYTEQNFPCLLLAGVQTIYPICFRVQLKLMPQDHVFTIGRDKACDFMTPLNMRISRVHCYIEKCDDGIFRVHDISKFGTEVVPEKKKKTFREKIQNIFASL